MQQLLKYELVFNLKTAKALGLTIPRNAIGHRRRVNPVATNGMTAVGQKLP